MKTREEMLKDPEYTWDRMAEEAGISLGTEPGACYCGCRSYRVKGSGTHVSAWVDPKHLPASQTNKPYLDHIYERVIEQASKNEVRLLAERFMRYAQQ